MAERVRAKFTLQSYETTIYNRTRRNPDGSIAKNAAGAYESERVEMRTLKFTPVYSEDPDSENKRFWDATPTGEIKLGTVNPEAWRQFEIGKQYYVDFSPAEPAEA